MVRGAPTVVRDELAHLEPAVGGKQIGEPEGLSRASLAEVYLNAGLLIDENREMHIGLHLQLSGVLILSVREERPQVETEEEPVSEQRLDGLDGGRACRYLGGYQVLACVERPQPSTGGILVAETAVLGVAGGVSREPEGFGG
jgi:hypothetical protein